MPNSQYILLIEDDLAHAELISRAFESTSIPLTLHRVSSLKEAYAHLDQNHPQLILADFRLPDGEGTELLPENRNNIQWPIIIMTSQGDEQLAVEALKAGALDYVVKSEETFANMPRIVDRSLRDWQNIIDRKMAEQALRQREQQLALAQRFAKFGSWELDVKTGAFQLSDEGYRLYEIDPSHNFTHQEQIKTYFEKHYDLENINRILNGIQTVSKTGQSTQIDLIINLPSGKQAYHTEHINPVFNNNGEVETIIGTIQDITQHKAAEEAQKVAERELEEQRTLSMRSDRLRSLGEMSAGIAHELNQPLMGVRGLAEHIMLAIDRGWDMPPKTLKERASKIVEQADRMTHIIEHIRLFSREAGNPECQPVNVNQVIESAIEMLSAQFRSHGLNLTSDLTPSLPQVSANPFSLEEVLLNLMTNARDAIDDKNKKGQADYNAEVVIRTFSINNTHVGIEVQDSGLGIPAEIISRVFDPFFTTKDPDKGTGLGLAISKSIIESFDGTLSIKSNTNIGTTLSIVLPTIPQN